MSKIITISDLRQRWWYRLIKVLFIFIHISISILTFYFTYQINLPKIFNDFKVTCIYGHKGTFFAFRDKQIYISPLEVERISTNSTMSDLKKEELISACGMSKAEIFVSLSEFGPAGAFEQDRAVLILSEQKCLRGSIYRR